VSTASNANSTSAKVPDKSHRKVIVFLGDSLTAGYGLSQSDSYPSLVQKYFDAEQKPWEVVNAGVSGDTTKGGLERVPWILKLKPTAVFVALGANDGLRGLSNDEAEKNLNEIVALLQKNKVIVFLAGMRMPLNYGSRQSQGFEDLFARVAEKNQIPLLPFLLKDVALESGKNQGDGIHPNREGTILVANQVIEFLKKHL
jgi:acyl-CoA thioesterase I